MTEHETQLTKTHLVGFLLLGASIWTIIIGVVYIIVAENSYAGYIITMTGTIAGYIIHRWLIYISKPKEKL